MQRVLPPDNPLDDQQRQTLLRLARESLGAAARGEPLPTGEIDDARLRERRGAFVTLYKGDQLRGCIGHFGQDMPLYEVVRRMTQSAALFDRRFEAIRLHEVDAITIQISALTPLRRVQHPNEIVIGRDGVRVSRGDRSGTLLPQVALEQGWDARALLAHACEHKAGLPPDAWRHGAVIETYGAEVFGEGDPTA